MKRLILTLSLLVVTLIGFAQDRVITGTLYDRDTDEGVMLATVQLLKTDSTFVTGALSDEDGGFSVNAPENGKYILKITSVGYKDLVKNIEVADDKDVALGNMQMGADAIMLKAAVVEGHAAKVVLKDDTFQYNASAFRTPEGSTIEALVKRLPGAQIDDNGKITINGKEVKKILVDGKEFMTGDTQTALKNIPTSIVDRVKAYDQSSDLARITGIDDGEEETVLDFGIKKGMNKGSMLNLDLGYGTHGRYNERVMGAWYDNKFKIMAFGSANNTNDQGFSGGPRGPGGGNNNGLNATKMLGVNLNYDYKKLQMDGSVRWNHSDGDINARQSVENFVSSTGAFSNSLSQTFNRKNSWDARFRLEWKPDSMTNIMFRPSFKYSTGDTRLQSVSASYNDDPYDYTDSPLEEESFMKLAALNLMVNTRTTTKINYTDSKSLGAMLQLNRKLSSNGRNITFRTDWSYGSQNDKTLSIQNVHLYQVKDSNGNDSTYQTNRFNTMPTDNWSYSLQTTYSEPIARKVYLQFSYKFTYKFNKSDRSTYDFSNLGEDFFSGVIPRYRGWDSYLSLLEHPYTYYLDDDLSRYSEYKNYIHDLQVMLRINRTKWNMNAGLMLQPQRSRYIQNYQGIHTDTTRTVTNFSPTFNFRYKFSKVSNLRINYRGTSSQPSMSDLLDITDNSDPMNVKKGNPGLKPSFTNRFRLFYNTYKSAHQQSLMTFVNFSNTRNSISDMVTYDEKTGGRTTQPKNINGNWDLNTALMYNASIDSAGYFNVNTFTNFTFNHYVSYINIDKTATAMKNRTNSAGIGERLSLSYRNLWLEVELDGALNYTRSRNKLQTESDLDTWQFSYGTNINFTLPWGTSISTDIHENSRRGYSDESLNTNELVWNAQVSQSFLKNKSLVVSLQWFDILRQQSSFSRVLNAIQRSDTEYNNINSYGMLKVSYKFNAFGGKDARNMRRGGDGDGPPHLDGEGGPGGPPPGGGPGGNRGNRGNRGGGGGFGGPMF